MYVPTYNVILSLCTINNSLLFYIYTYIIKLNSVQFKLNPILATDVRLPLLLVAIDSHNNTDHNKIKYVI